MDDSQPLHPAIRGLKTVCRCNNIKYRTIERAIREGAHTLEAVALKTGATTGHCGGTCTPDVQAMLAEHAPAKAGSSKAAKAGSPLAAKAGSPKAASANSRADAAASSDNQSPAAEGAANANAWWVRKS